LAQAGAPQPILRGRAALHVASHHHIQLHAWDDARGWVPCESPTDDEMRGCAPEELAFRFGVFALPSRDQQCVSCWVDP
jgi:hypothetical protein